MCFSRIKREKKLVNNVGLFSTAEPLALALSFCCSSTQKGHLAVKLDI